MAARSDHRQRHTPGGPEIRDLNAQVLDLVGEVSGLLDLDEFRAGLLATLNTVLPSDFISLNQVASDPEENWSIVEPPLSADEHATYYRLALQNPLAAYFLRTRDGRPLRLSDISSPDEFRTTEIYREVYAPLRIEHQIAFALPSDERNILAIALSRCEQDFNDHERDLLSIARPHLIQAYRNAVYVSRKVPGREPSRPLGLDEHALQALGLTPSQARVLRMIAMGRSTTNIANDLQIARRTVHKHLQRTYQKLGVKDRSAAAQTAWGTVQISPPRRSPPA